MFFFEISSFNFSMPYPSASLPLTSPPTCEHIQPTPQKHSPGAFRLSLSLPLPLSPPWHRKATKTKPIRETERERAAGSRLIPCSLSFTRALDGETTPKFYRLLMIFLCFSHLFIFQMGFLPLLFTYTHSYTRGNIKINT